MTQPEQDHVGRVTAWAIEWWPFVLLVFFGLLAGGATAMDDCVREESK